MEKMLFMLSIIFAALIIAFSIVNVQATNSTNTSAISIPKWIKNNAKWWSEGSVDDTSFVQGLQYLIQKGIMKIPPTDEGESKSDKIPTWIKNNAGWWAQDLISDSDFVSGIQYLISHGIMKISPPPTPDPDYKPPY